MAEIDAVDGPQNRPLPDFENSPDLGNVGVRTARRGRQTEVEGASSGETEDDVSPVEDVAEQVIDGTRTALAAPSGRAAIAQDIDGETAESRSEEQTTLLDRSFDELEQSGDLDVEVIVAQPGDTNILTTEDGEFVDASLTEGQDSKLVETSTGQTVLVIDEGLSEEEAVIEASDAVATIIKSVVEANGGFVDVEFYQLFADAHFKAVRENHYAYSIGYGGFLVKSLDL